jgi:CheY-like chemotaxis protein
MITKEEFTAHVKDALAHLYDYVHLQSHPLSEHLVAEDDTSATTRAKRLRAVIVGAIEEVRPETDVPFGSREWRGYRILYQRYVEGMSPEQVMENMALSSSHFYRCQHDALEAVASLLWDAVPIPEDNRRIAAESEVPLDLLEAEVEQMSAHSVRERLSLDQVLQQVAPLVRGLASKRKVDLKLEIAGGLPTVFMGRAVLRQILLNALYRAVEWSVEGDLVTVTADLGHDGMDVKVSVGGTGQESWRRLGDPSGLTPARRLAERQGGDVQVRLNDGTITLLLPTEGQTVVLVVDDNEDAIRLFSRYLNGHGYQVVAARSGEEAQRLASDLEPQIITLDVMMPERDGWETLQSLKNHAVTRPIPVLVCSVLDEPELTLSLGAQEHLLKPISQEALLAALDRWRPKPAGTGGNQE